MPDPNQNASDQAKAVLDALFADPAQQHPDPRAIAETLHGGLDDPAHNLPPGQEAKLDPAWHQTPDGVWHNPHFPDDPGAQS